MIHNTDNAYAGIVVLIVAAVFIGLMLYRAHKNGDKPEDEARKAVDAVRKEIG